MKKQLLLASFILLSIQSLGGSIDYLSQQDAEYFAYPALTGKIGVSGAYYNPAGTAFLENGTYMQLNNQTHFKTYKMKKDGMTFESDKPSPFVPSMQLVHVNNGRAFFFHVGALAGGGNVAYKGGLGTFAAMDDSINSAISPFGSAKFIGGSTVNGSSYYVNIQGGIAQKLNDELSFAVGARYISAKRTLKGSGTFQLKGLGMTTEPVFDIDSERTADGIGGIFGLNYKPNDKLNIGIRYETEVRLNFETDEHNLNSFKEGLNQGFGKVPLFGTTVGNLIYNSVTSNPAVKEWTKGQKGKRNLPAMASLGASYRATEKTTLLLSGNYYFIKSTGDNFGAYDSYDNGYEVALGLDYQLTPKWTLMTGYQYTNTGANSKTYKDTDYALDAHLYGVGAKYKYNENIDLLASLASVFYQSGTSSITGIKYEKHVESVGIGMIYKF